MAEFIQVDHHRDGIDRRGFLSCMAWAGAGVLWTGRGGVLGSTVLEAGKPGGTAAGFSFVQISDSHIGFNKEANADVVATLREAIARINALPAAPDFVIHTGDLTHLSKPSEFDTLDQLLREVKTSRIFFVPGEHDVLGDQGAQFRERHGRDTVGNGWYSFDHRGVHFVGLVNVLDLKAGGLGLLGDTQLDWLKRDLAGRGASTPIVVFAHMPLWAAYPEWGWATEDSVQAMGYLRRFGSVTVLNGHIHQVLQKVEGRVTFHTAMSTAFPQPRPGTAPSPGPMTVPAGELRHLLGLTDVNYVQRRHALAVIDSALA
jgi:3',5'-cyclic AMP phosphodiesterase CpdA